MKSLNIGPDLEEDHEHEHKHEQGNNHVEDSSSHDRDDGHERNGTWEQVQAQEHIS